MQLQDFRSTLRTLGNFPSNDTQITDAVIDAEVNRALRRIAMRHDWPWLQDSRTIVTVAGQDTYALPDDFLRLDTLYVPNTNENLILRGKTEINEYPHLSRPRFFAIYGGKILIASGQTGWTLRLDYIKQESVLVNDSDAPLIPDYWSDGVLFAALSELHKMMKQVDLAGLAESRFNTWVTETQDNVRQTEAAPRIRPRRNGWI